MDAVRTSNPMSRGPMSRRRRWLIVLAACALLGGLYAGALTWVSLRLETDIQKSIRPLPLVIEDRQHRAD